MEDEAYEAPLEYPADWAIPKPYERTITFNDDTVLVGHAGLTPYKTDLWLYPESDQFSLPEIIMIFSNPEKTSRIEYHKSEEDVEVYEGYTHLSTINSLPDGKFSIRLNRPIT